MKKFFNLFLSAFAILFAIPSFLILVSWNALPGETLYGVKTGLEDVALLLTIRTPLASAFSLNFTERRFSEANRLLTKKGSTVGYTLLVAEARETQGIIVDQNDSKKAEELITKIEEYQARIEEKRVALASQPSAILPPEVGTKTPSSSVTPVPSPGQTPKPTSTPAPAPPGQPEIPAPTPAASVDEVIDDLEETNEELEEIKEEIKRQLPSSASEKAKEQQEEHERDNPRRD